ncbi:MAG: hypothetical protein ACQGVC_10525 [Myxococcota bacterium]
MGDTARASARRTVQAALAVLLAAGVLAVFGPTTGHGFVGFDDERYVLNNRALHGGLDGEAWRMAWTRAEFSNWHPLTWLSFALDVELHGLDPAGFHATNVALHLLNTLLVFALLAGATGAVWPAAGVAALFAWHPLHVEPVAWISERKELLAALFGLLASGAYLGWARRGGALRYAAVALCLTASLLAKPMWVTLPLLLLALDHWPLGRLAEDPRARLREKAPLFALSLLAAGVTLAVQQPAIATGAAVGLGDRLANAAVSSVRYLAEVFRPAPYSILRPHPALPGGAGFDTAGVLGSLLALVLLVWGAWRLRARAWVPAGLAWFAVALLPVIGLVQVGEQAMADRYTYVALLGPFWILAFGARDVHAALRARTPGGAAAFAAGLAAALVGLAFASAERAQAFRDTITLYERSLAATPNSPTLHFNLGNRLLATGRDADALPRYEAALRLRPGWDPAMQSLAWLLATSGDAALRDPSRALALATDVVAAASPADPNALDTLAAAQAASGDLTAAAVTAGRAADAARARGHPASARAYDARRRLYESGRAYVRAGSTRNSTVR